MGGWWGGNDLEARRKSCREWGVTFKNSCRMFFLEAWRSTLRKPWNGPGSSWAHPHAKEHHLLHEANHQNMGAAAAHTTVKPETQPLGDHQHHRQWNMPHQQPESSPKELQSYLRRDVGLGWCSETCSRCKLENFEENDFWIGLTTPWDRDRVCLHWNGESDLSLQKQNYT